MIEISNNDKFIDSREINVRIVELEAEIAELLEGKGDQGYMADGATPDEAREELALLKGLKEECGHPDWDFGLTLIREGYFETYVEQMADDLGAIDSKNAGWIVIDWKATADNVRIDYSTVDFDGVTYLVR